SLGKRTGEAFYCSGFIESFNKHVQSLTHPLESLVVSTNIDQHPRTPPGGLEFEYQMTYSEHSKKRACVGPSDEVSFSSSTHPSNMYSPDDLPRSEP
nr:protein TPR2-like isoform X1 [Tanacetum cinerariifolium]